MHPAPSVNSGTFGSEVRAKAPRNTAVIASTTGREMSCETISSPRLLRRCCG